MCQLLPSLVPYYVDSVLLMRPLHDQLRPRATQTRRLASVQLLEE